MSPEDALAARGSAVTAHSEMAKPRKLVLMDMDVPRFASCLPTDAVWLVVLAMTLSGQSGAVKLPSLSRSVADADAGGWPRLGAGGYLNQRSVRAVVLPFIPFSSLSWGWGPAPPVVPTKPVQRSATLFRGMLHSGGRCRRHSFLFLFLPFPSF